MALYRSFEIGKMSIVAPLSASYPVLTLLLFCFDGERLTWRDLWAWRWRFLGVILVARGETLPDDANAIDAGTQPAKKRPWCGLGAAGGGGLWRDVLVLGIRVVPLLGGAPTVWIIRLTSFSFACARDSDC